MNFLGVDGINSRISEIQSRLDAITPRERPEPLAGGFKSHLDACGPQPLEPRITGGETTLSGTIGGAPELRAMAQQAASRYGLDPDLFEALVDQESGWNPSATSRVGAQGLCQLMPGTAAELGVRNAYDPEQSLDGGARYLRQMIDRCGGDVTRGLASYNAGFGRIKGSAPAHWPAETKGYVRSILSRYERNV